MWVKYLFVRLYHPGELIIALPGARSPLPSKGVVVWAAIN